MVLTSVLDIAQQVFARKGSRKVTFKEVRPNAFKTADEALKMMVLQEVESLYKDARKLKW